MLELVVEDLHAGYGHVSVLHGVSLAVCEGETVVLLGTNGNGKSTLMKCVMGLLRPTQGRIILRETGRPDLDLIGLAAEARAGLGIALVAEGRRLFPKLTVEENLILGASPPKARARLADNLAGAYRTFPVLKEKRRQLAGSMSGGQQQMLAIARALMSEPRLLLVDEPSVGLAPILVQQVIATIADLKRERGLTVLMAEQNFHQASTIADRGYVLVHGAVAFHGESLAALQANDVVKELYLGT